MSEKAMTDEDLTWLYDHARDNGAIGTESTLRLIRDLRQARGDLIEAEARVESARELRDKWKRVVAEVAGERDEMRASRDVLLAENDRLRALASTWQCPARCVPQASGAHADTCWFAHPGVAR